MAIIYLLSINYSTTLERIYVCINYIKFSMDVFCSLYEHNADIICTVILIHPQIVYLFMSNNESVLYTVFEYS